MRFRIGLFLVLITLICLAKIRLVKTSLDQKRQLATIELQYEALLTEQTLLKAELHRLRHQNRHELAQQTNESDPASHAE